MTTEQRLRELPKAIIRWYEIEKKSRVACIVADCGNSRLMGEALADDGVLAENIPLGALDGWRENYDMVIAIDVVEYVRDTDTFFNCIRHMLRPGGKFLMTADNRLGIRYFCGDQDMFSGKSYDGIENYRHLLPWELEAMRGRAYSKAELTNFLERAGFYRHRFFSVFPRISNPQILLAEDYEPNEALDIRVFPEYNNPGTIFLLEEELYPALMENKLLHPMANGFFIECPLQSEPAPVNQVTLSGERGAEHAMATIIRSDGLVEKRALYPEGRERLGKLVENHQYLSAHGIKMIPMEQRGGSLVMPYVSGLAATDYFRSLLERDQDVFLGELDRFWETISRSSEAVPFDGAEGGLSGGNSQKEDSGLILKRGYLDLVSLNCFYVDGEFVFYDQELYLENVPAEAIMLRTIEFIYKFQDHLDGVLPRDTLFERYGITKHRDLYDQWVNRFLDTLRRDHELSDYFEAGRRDYGVVMKNRERMNYSEEEYTRIFKDIFRHAKGRKLYLFGSGKYARSFRETYGALYHVAGYLDNDETRWGTEIEGCVVYNPAVLEEMGPEEYKVIICIKNYLPVIRQLRGSGISDFSVYRPYIE